MPTVYNQMVEVTNGPFRGHRGRFIGDCSGFENYKIKTSELGEICIRVWNLKRI